MVGNTPLAPVIHCILSSAGSSGRKLWSNMLDCIFSLQWREEMNTHTQSGVLSNVKKKNCLDNFTTIYMGNIIYGNNPNKFGSRVVSEN